MSEPMTKGEITQLLGNMFSGGESPGMSFQIDLKSVFVVLAVSAMCVGKEPEEIYPATIVRAAFDLQNLLFKPDGTLND